MAEEKAHEEGRRSSALAEGLASDEDAAVLGTNARVQLQLMAIAYMSNSKAWI